MKNKNRIKKLEEKIDTRAQKSFCIFQEKENCVVRYNDKEYRDLEAFKVENDVSDLDKILIIRFIG